MTSGSSLNVITHEVSRKNGHNAESAFSSIVLRSFFQAEASSQVVRLAKQYPPAVKIAASSDRFKRARMGNCDSGWHCDSEPHNNPATFLHPHPERRAHCPFQPRIPRPSEEEVSFLHYSLLQRPPSPRDACGQSIRPRCNRTWRSPGRRCRTAWPLSTWAGGKSVRGRLSWCRPWGPC